MFIRELFRADPRREAGGRRFLRTGLRDRVISGRNATRLSLIRRPSFGAGLFFIPSDGQADLATWRRRFYDLLRAQLWVSFPSIVCLWLTSCSCLPEDIGPVSVQQATPFATSPTVSTNDVNLTILTYNVWGLPLWLNHEPRARYVRIASDLEHLHPDLVLLQEVWTKSAAAVVPTNGGWLVAQAPSANFFHRNGLMILSRLPVIGAEFHAFRKAAFPDSIVRKGALKVTVQAPGGQRFNIWNVHLQADAPRVRRRQIEQLATWVRDAHDCQAADLVGGDFNSTPDSPEFKQLSEDLGQTAHEVARLPFSPTFDGLSSDSKRAQTIDYFFIRPRTSISKLEAVPTITFTNAIRGRRFSDHMALEVALRFHFEGSFTSTSLTNGLNQRPAACSSHAAATPGY
jgi:endonuclease/exonuclease/phosphatase family metal-dependent hydrolase